MKKLYILVGPSGVGKGTVEEFLFKKPELKLKSSVSVTTRQIRDDEVEGKHYYFVSKEEFIEKSNNNEFIEWNEHFNNFYGTLKSEIEKIQEEGLNPFLVVETIGALNIIKHYKKYHPEEKVITFFLIPPNMEELKRRIVNRGSENEKQIEERLKKAKKELKEMVNFSYLITNYNSEESANLIGEIILNGKY